MTNAAIISDDRVTEREVSLAVIAYLQTKPAGRREASFKELTFMLPGKFLQLRQTDREWQRHRKGEQKWHAVLRNIGAHAGQPGNAITEGLLIKRVGGGYALTDLTSPDNAQRQQ